MKITDFIEFMKAHDISNIIWLWKDCPLEEKYTLNHGGDEDYVILWKTSSLGDRVEDRLTVCDSNSCEIEGDFRLCVTAHA